VKFRLNKAKENTMAIVITYTELARNTRDPLRKIHNMAELKELANLYWQVMERQQDPQYTYIWRNPTMAMPKKTVIPNKKYALQTPREFLEGFMEKINRHQGNDLSPKQCEGFTNFNKWFSAEFGTDRVVFADKNDMLNQPDLTAIFEAI
jgi:hypothetical protein